jgi:uncharacterized delta-60 repeat protein
MSFSISNTSASAVITKLSTPSSVTGELTITSGSLPLVEGDFISGTNTEITNTKGSQYGTIQMFLQQGDVQIDTFVNNSLYSTDTYGSGMISVQTPILQSSDSLTMAVSDSDFDCYDFGTGFNGEVTKGIELSDGKLLMVGAFTTYKGVSARRIVRLNPDMSRDTTFNIGTGFSATVNSVAVQSDDKILVGGNFTTYSGVARNRIVRLNTDGSLDTTFNIGTGFSAIVNSIVVQSDDKILVGGNFTTYSGVSYGRLIRLNTNGSIDTTFVNPSINDAVYEIGVQSDGKILPVGDFTSVSGVSINGICRLSSTGLIEEAFNPILSGDISSAYAISIQSDNKIVIGGFFDTVSGNSSPRIARLLSGGTYDASFVVGAGFDTSGAGNNAYISDISLSQGKYLVSGLFNEYSGASIAYVVRLNTNGSIDTTFNQGTGFTTVADPLDVINFSMGNGNIVVGNTQGYNGEVIPRIAILTPFGGLLNCV